MAYISSEGGRDARTVFKSEFLKEIQRRLAELVERRAVARWFLACEFSRDVYALHQDVALLLRCHLVGAFVGVAVQPDLGA
jgi:hypothetical protein